LQVLTAHQWQIKTWASTLAEKLNFGKLGSEESMRIDYEAKFYTEDGNSIYAPIVAFELNLQGEMVGWIVSDDHKYLIDVTTLERFDGYYDAERDDESEEPWQGALESVGTIFKGSIIEGRKG